jgi:hypothetical protein
VNDAQRQPYDYEAHSILEMVGGLSGMFAQLGKQRVSRLSFGAHGGDCQRGAVGDGKPGSLVSWQ